MSLIQVRVKDRRILADGIVGLDLVNSSGGPLPKFTAGAHVDVHLPGGLIRQYSLCNNPAETHCYSLGVLLEPGGRGGSARMHALGIDECLTISPPRNHFPLSDAAKMSVLVAGGIGITPIVAMAYQLHAEGAAFLLHYCARSKGRMAFADTLRNAPFAANVRIHLDDGPEEEKLDIKDLGQNPPDGGHLYVCGPGGFITAVLAAAEEQWPKSSLHREYFSAPADTSIHTDRPFDIKLVRSGHTLHVPTDRSAIEVLAEAGIEIPTSCEQGMCGTCMATVLEGIPEHRDLVMTDEEHDANNQMTLCCSRARTEMLVLDL